MRDEPAIDAKPFFREPFDDVGRGERFSLSFRDRFALLLREQRRNVVRAFAHQARGFPHDPASGGGRKVAPRLEPPLGGFQRAIQIRTAGVRDTANFLSGRRIMDRERTAVDRILPSAGNEELGIDVAHANSCD